jgi:hypothetical protein
MIAELKLAPHHGRGERQAAAATLSALQNLELLLATFSRYC